MKAKHAAQPVFTVDSVFAFAAPISAQKVLRYQWLECITVACRLGSNVYECVVNMACVVTSADGSRKIVDRCLFVGRDAV